MPQYAAIYTIKPGDTLAKIAQQYSLTIYELAYANGINASQVIYVGQKLGIPKIHPVSQLQTLSYIALTNSTTVQNMSKLNNLDPAKPLVIGRRLMISL